MPKVSKWHASTQRDLAAWLAVAFFAFAVCLFAAYGLSIYFDPSDPTFYPMPLRVCLPLAKSAGRTLTLVLTVFYLTMLRSFQTLLRSVPIVKTVVPVDALMPEFHKGLVVFVCFFAVVHVAGHICNFMSAQMPWNWDFCLQFDWSEAPSPQRPTVCLLTTGVIMVAFLAMTVIISIVYMRNRDNPYSCFTRQPPSSRNVPTSTAKAPQPWSVNSDDSDTTGSHSIGQREPHSDDSDCSSDKGQQARSSFIRSPPAPGSSNSSDDDRDRDRHGKRLPYKNRRYWWFMHVGHWVFGIGFLILLCIHPSTNGRSEVAVPFMILFALFVIDMFLRYGALLSHTVHILDGSTVVDAGKDRFVHLVLSRPSNLPFTPGQYVNLRIRQLDSMWFREFHPFTIASPPTQHECLEFVIKCDGDWTDGLANIITNMKHNAHQHASPPPIAVQLIGPYGAPAQLHAGYETVVLIAANHGITPMLSIFRNYASAHFGSSDDGTPPAPKKPFSKREQRPTSETTPLITAASRLPALSESSSSSEQSASSFSSDSSSSLSYTRVGATTVSASSTTTTAGASVAYATFDATVHDTTTTAPVDRTVSSTADGRSDLSTADGRSDSSTADGRSDSSTHSAPLVESTPTRLAGPRTPISVIHNDKSADVDAEAASTRPPMPQASEFKTTFSTFLAQLPTNALTIFFLVIIELVGATCNGVYSIFAFDSLAYDYAMLSLQLFLAVVSFALSLLRVSLLLFWECNRSRRPRNMLEPTTTLRQSAKQHTTTAHYRQLSQVTSAAAASTASDVQQDHERRRRIAIDIVAETVLLAALGAGIGISVWGIVLTVTQPHVPYLENVFMLLTIQGGVVVLTSYVRALIFVNHYSPLSVDAQGSRTRFVHIACLSSTYQGAKLYDSVLNLDDNKIPEGWTVSYWVSDWTGKRDRPNDVPQELWQQTEDNVTPWDVTLAAGRTAAYGHKQWRRGNVFATRARYDPEVDSPAQIREKQQLARANVRTVQHWLQSILRVSQSDQCVHRHVGIFFCGTPEVEKNVRHVVDIAQYAHLMRVPDGYPDCIIKYASENF